MFAAQRSRSRIRSLVFAQLAGASLLVGLSPAIAQTTPPPAPPVPPGDSDTTIIVGGTTTITTSTPEPYCNATIVGLYTCTYQVVGTMYPDGSTTDVPVLDLRTSIYNAGTATTTYAPVILNGIAGGEISATSSQVVVGSQIYANQQSVADLFGGGVTVNPDGTLSPGSFIVGGTTYGNVADALGALGSGWNVTTAATGSGVVSGTSVANVAPGATHTITAGDNIVATQNGTEVQLAVNPNLNVTSVTAGNTVLNTSGVTITGGANGTVALTNTGLNNGGNTLSNVAAGVNATDAVNVSQLESATLAGTNADQAAVKYVWNDADGDGVVDPGEVDYTQVQLAGTGGTTISNLAPGAINATSTQAVNGSQIFANQTSVAAALGGGTVVNPDGTLSAPSYTTTTGTYTNVGDALAAANTQTNAVGTSVAAGLGGTSSYDPATGTITTALPVGGATYTTVTDALNAVNVSATAGWNVTTTATGSGVVSGTSVANVGPNGTHTITAGDNIVATQNGTEVQLAVNPNLAVTSVTTGNTVLNTSGVSITGGANGTVALTNTGLNNGGNTLTNVAAGVNATDAVNVGQQTALGNSTAAALGGGSSYNPATGQVTAQLAVGSTNYASVNDAINAINATANAGWNIQANGGPATNIATNGTLNLNSGQNVTVALNGNTVTVSTVANPTFAGTVTANGGLVVGAGQTVSMGGNVVSNVGAGQVAAASTDAVNGGQLYQVQQVAANSVQYDNAARNSVTFNPGGAAAVLHNVAPGVALTDAVNVGQLESGVARALGAATAYTDAQVARIDFNLGGLRNEANAGIAGAMAAAGMPQAFEPGKGMLAFGAGTYGGEYGFALGLSRVMDDGKTVVKAGATYNSRNSAAANVGVGFQF